MIANYKKLILNTNNELFKDKNYKYLDTLKLDWRLLYEGVVGLVNTDIYLNKLTKEIIMIVYYNYKSTPSYISDSCKFTRNSLESYEYLYARNEDMFKEFKRKFVNDLSI